MVALLGKQQAEDDKSKTYCEGEFDKAADEEAAAKTKLGSLDAALAEQTDAISTLMEEINTLTTEISSLDKSVADATDQRKMEHADYIEFIQMSEAALALVEKAKNRLNKFYNPTLYKAAPKTERTMEGKIIDAGTFVQVQSHRRLEVAQAPETFSGEYKKSEKSAGVLGLMDMMVREIETDMKDSAYAEKTSQADYGKLMEESEATGAANSQGIVTKTASKAEVESKLLAAKEAHTAVSTDLDLIAATLGDLHMQCDFLLQNYDLRKEARTNEIESLKNAKAI